MGVESGLGCLHSSLDWEDVPLALSVPFFMFITLPATVIEQLRLYQMRGVVLVQGG
jgi:hypothetical protein